MVLEWGGVKEREEGGVKEVRRKKSITKLDQQCPVWWEKVQHAQTGSRTFGHLRMSERREREVKEGRKTGGGGGGVTSRSPDR